MSILGLKEFNHLCCVITTIQQLNCSEKDQYSVYRTYTNVCKYCLTTTVEYLLTVTSLTRQNTFLLLRVPLSWYHQNSNNYIPY